MFKCKFRKRIFSLLLAFLTLSVGSAWATDTSTSSQPAGVSASSDPSTSSSGIVSGTDPEPASPDIVQLMLSILNFG